MAGYKCPKCGGSDYFMSQRNVVKGMGWAQRGSIKSIPVCRVCDEIMEGSQVGFKNWEDYGDGRSTPSGTKLLSKRTKLIFILACVISLALTVVPIPTVQLIGVFIFYSGVTIGLMSFFIDYRKTR